MSTYFFKGDDVDVKDFFKQGDKDWFRDYCIAMGLSFADVKKIFKNSNNRTLQDVWQRKNSGTGLYADVLEHWLFNQKNKK